MNRRILDLAFMLAAGYLLVFTFTADPVSALWGFALPLIDKLLG